MKHIRAMPGASSVLASVVALAFLLFQASDTAHGAQSAVPTRQGYVPSVALWTTGSAWLGQSTDGFSVSAGCDIYDQVVKVRWVHASGRSLSQEFTTSFYPHVVDGTGDVLVVVGSNSDGDDVVERWALTGPAMTRSAAGGVRLHDAVVRRTPVLIPTSPLRTGISSVWLDPRSGDTEAFLRWSSPRGELTKIDLDSGAHDVVLAAATLPGLGDRMHRQFWTGDHPTYGHVFVFFHPEHVLVVTDQSREGLEYAGQIMTGAQYLASPFDDSTAYTVHDLDS